ncbi:MAG: DEAD/DEAH box helicase family protein, partial [Candidatus Poribacteria bacterium]|nr:DEAD/DEAH box helicase family protein [Candidatus Poribacteria bacterium]
MPEQFLFQELNSASNLGFLNKEIPDSIRQNLNPVYELREYQIDAFARFIHCLNNNFPGKENPLHLLFNMATGSGKTLIMAGLILYLYEQGYRNFLFFVNSTNIIEKTRDNFLNPRATKYLFSENIHIDGQKVAVTEVDNFDGVNENDINICFTTIQQLHTDMNSEKENALTYENFAEQRIVLLADEAHHMNVSTRSQQGQELFESWENTVERIFKSNVDNLLLEFTATHDYENDAMVEKYRNKVINRYDLVNFRNDKFSKEVVLVHSDLDQQSRILQTLILNQYKQEVAQKNGINLKPVILFKAQRTIEQSEKNKADFHKLIDELTATDIDKIRNSDVE